ncbi:MAG: signal peptidase I [bacterium]|nr:signal peptidase I [bacterium]
MGSRTGHTDERSLSSSEIPEKGTLREYAEVILTCLLFLLFARTFVFQQSEIPSGSMEDTILIGDYVLVNRFLYAPTSFDWERALLPIRDIRRGDIVVFKNPEEPERDYIKRVIGLPGDQLAMRDGAVFVNGARLEEPYVNELYRTMHGYGPVTVPDSKFFLMGDHRNLSRDSRSWGPAGGELVKGRAFMILFSTSTPPDPSNPGQVTLRSLLSKVVNLVFYMRWDRAGRMIR